MTTQPPAEKMPDEDMLFPDEVICFYPPDRVSVLSVATLVVSDEWRQKKYVRADLAPSERDDIEHLTAMAIGHEVTHEKLRVAEIKVKELEAEVERQRRVISANEIALNCACEAKQTAEAQATRYRRALEKCFAVMIADKFQPDSGQPSMVKDGIWDQAVTMARSALSQTQEGEGNG